MRTSAFAVATAILAAATCSGAQAQDVAASSADNSFTLGQIIVTAPDPDEVTIGSSTLKAEPIYLFNRTSLDEAARLIPGVTGGNSGGSRNERLIFVRGFDRFQVPLSIDGIRIYLPADNRLDYGRFLTPDIAELQVAKGYASVLDGPGGMGGAINLVTRKPTKAIEAEMRGTLNLDRDADYAGYSVFGLLGTKQDQWYAQASFARTFIDHWDLPGGVAARPNEDGGARDFSRAKDWRVNLKAGFTPNATDEYTISYTRQEGAKNAPLHLTDTSNVSLRNWNWPYWNIESVYFLSTTALSSTATLKTRAFYSNFDNLLRSWDNRQQNSQALPRSFNSPYSDTSYGGSAELAVDLLPADRFTLAFHYRRDEHQESQTSRPDLGSSVPEPVQTSAERNWSIAAENRYAFSPALSLTAGVSFDWRDLDRAEEFGVPLGSTGASRLFSFPLRNAQAPNGQARLDWSAADDSALHLSVSSRARFPTLFERFSSQFGTAQANPDLKPERATNAELGGSHSFGKVRLTGAVFYSWLSDALVSVRTPANLNRRENLGSADYYGAELSVDAEILPSLSAGANYSYIHRSFDVGTTPVGGLIRPFELTDVPDHKGFAWVSWRPIEELNILPSIDWASNRTTVTPASANGVAPVYYGTGAYVTADLRINYAVTERIEVGVGAQNLFDDYYVLTDGFPERGRSFFASLRARY